MGFFKQNKQSFKYEIVALSLLSMLAWVYFFEGGNTHIYILIASILGLYMACNIWANDVANNMGPAVGSKAITLTWAIIIAAIFEASGAIIAGWDVVNTIKGAIISPSSSEIADSGVYIFVMMSTLLWAAIWINVATVVKAPVSATHSIIWALLWAWVSAYGLHVINWSTIGNIAASWVISPVLWGIISALLLYSITKNILQKDDRIHAAKVWVPIYIAGMFWIFSVYLILKWLKPLISSSPVLQDLLTLNFALFAGCIIACASYIIARVYFKKHSGLFKNSKKFINSLFNVPLICAVALLSFAHGSNDVANAIGPLAAIVDRVQHTGVSSEALVWIPLWIMILWALWLVAGLSLFGGRLIKTVGKEITKLNQTRAYAVALSAAITVLIASQLGLPVSSTHIAIGWVFGVGFLRSFLKKLKGKQKTYVEKEMIGHIVLSWIVTLPISAVIASVIFFSISAFQ